MVQTLNGHRNLRETIESGFLCNTDLFHTLCESDERYQLQYRFVNPLESDLKKSPKSTSTLILRPRGCPFEKINIENGTFAL